MAEQNDNGVKTFEADAAISQFARVKLDADGKVTNAGLTDREIGTAQRDAFPAADIIPVKLRTAAGSHKMIAVEASAVGAHVYTEASGKVQDTAASTSYLLGIAVNASSADGDIVEVIYNAHGDTAVA